MSLLILLFLIVVVCISAFKQYSVDVRYSRNLDRFKENYKKSMEMMTDRNLAIEYDKYVKTANRCDVMDKVHSIYPFDIPIQSGYYLEDICVQILMSQHGKIYAMDSSGIRSSTIIDRSRPISEAINKRIQLNEYIRWYDKQMREHGVTDRIVFKPRNPDSDGCKKYYELYEVDQLEMRSGNFVFTFMENDESINEAVFK